MWFPRTNVWPSQPAPGAVSKADVFRAADNAATRRHADWQQLEGYLVALDTEIYVNGGADTYQILSELRPR